MNPQKNKLYFSILAFTILFIATLACNGSTPGLVPSLPKPGHWSNGNEANREGPISFDLSDAGKISNLNMTVSFGTPTQGCTINLNQLQMQINKDSTFVISYSMTYEEVTAELGPAVMSLSLIPEGKPYEVLRISGNLTSTKMNGTYKVSVCSNTLFLENNTGPWKVQWKNP